MQVNRALPASETVEGTLESALHAAGFIADTNMGDFDRIRWSRSSRTDKGVHSLSLVRWAPCNGLFGSVRFFYICSEICAGALQNALQPTVCVSPG